MAGSQGYESIPVALDGVLLRTFDQLSQGGQVRRLAKVASKALSQYSFGHVRLRPIHHFLNTVFRVDVAVGANDSQVDRYALRIHRPGYHDRRALESELNWLRAVRGETSLSVSEPVATNVGELVANSHDDAVPGDRLCVLFRWLDGRRPAVDVGPGFYRRLGKLLAILHRHSEQFRPDTDFVRQRWDLRGICGAAVGVRPDVGIASVPQSYRKVIGEVVAVVENAMNRLGEDHSVFGLIHSDVSRHNVLLHNGELRLLDFDGSGWGYYLYDIAVPLAEIAGSGNRSNVGAALLAGYRSERQLSDEEVSHIDAFICARLMVHAIWFASHYNEPMFGRRDPLFLDRQLARLEAVLRGQ